jgi:hypothetical protein
MQTSNPVSEAKWFLGTGPKEYFYTLWRQVVIRPVPGTYVGGCFWTYYQNLSHNYEEAVTKATERTGQTSWEQFDISDYKRINKGNPDLDKTPAEITFTFGKYQGRTLESVLDLDVSYILFLALKSDWEPRQAVHAKVLNYIRAMFHEQAANVDAERKERLNAERAERDAARADLPAFQGRATVLGTVISTKVVESDFGTTVKMLVEHADGWKVWGSVPNSLFLIGDTQRALVRGDVVRFDAKIQKSDQDPKFGFFSRPTKATLVTPIAA